MKHLYTLIFSIVFILASFTCAHAAKVLKSKKLPAPTHCRGLLVEQDLSRGSLFDRDSYGVDHNSDEFSRDSYTESSTSAFRDFGSNEDDSRF